MLRLPFLVSTILTLTATSAAAQVVSLDEGSFTLYRDGERIGREDFSIRSAPGADGRMLVAQATQAIGQRRTAPGVNADTNGFPVRYQREVREAGQVVESYSGQASRNRYASLLRQADGDSAREFRLTAGTVVADDDIVHQLWFIARRGAGATVPVLVPQRNVVESVRVERVGAERLSIDLRQFETVRLALHGPGGSLRELWISPDGRIIKASIPALHLTALRDCTEARAIAGGPAQRSHHPFATALQLKPDRYRHRTGTEHLIWNRTRCAC